jgi:hypothetical protein
MEQACELPAASQRQLTAGNDAGKVEMRYVDAVCGVPYSTDHMPADPVVMVGAAQCPARLGTGLLYTYDIVL